MKDLPIPFNYYQMVLDSDHFHFGLWPDGMSEDSLEQAQERMFEVLFGYFPKPPATVLDIGCGLGKSAFFLACQGYQVTAISPSEELIEYALKHYTHQNIAFHPIGFLESEQVFGLQEYDVLFFQESLQYLHPLYKVFCQARRFLKPKGMVIIGDEIRYDRQLQEHTAVHLWQDIQNAVLSNGFRLKIDQRVGQNVNKTCVCIIQRFENQLENLMTESDKGKTQEILGGISYYLQGWRQQRKWYENGQFDYVLLVAKKDQIFCQEFEQGDEHDILALFEQIFGQKRSLEHWYWKFRDNPFGNLKIAKAISDNGGLAAHFSGYPVPFYSKTTSEDEFFAYQVGDTMTNPAFRTHGLGSSSVLARVATFFFNCFCLNQVPFVYGFNTGNIRKFGERYLNYRYIRPIPYHILDTNRLRSSSFLSQLTHIISGYSVEKMEIFGKEIDALFYRVANDYDLLVKRTSDYLGWRYLQCPDGKYDIYAVKRFGKLIGWSVFTLRDKTLLWGDALFDKKYLNSVEIFLKILVKSWYPEVQSIEGWFSPEPRWWTQTLEGIGFESHQEPNNLAPAFVFFDPRFSKDVLDSHMYYTMGDSDLF